MNHLLFKFTLMICGKQLFKLTFIWSHASGHVVDVSLISAHLLVLLLLSDNSFGKYLAV